MKYIILVAISFSILLSDACYRDKNKQICYKRYYKVKNIKKPMHGEKYYLSKKGTIYTFKDRLIVKIKYSGAILSILRNFEVEFKDKIRHNIYVLKANEPNELLGIITNLNKLDSVLLAKPELKIKRKKGYVKRKQVFLKKEKKKKDNKFAPKQAEEISNDKQFSKTKTD